MISINVHLIFVGLFVVVHFGNARFVPEKTVTELMLSNVTDKIGLINYFNELGLSKHCKSPLLNVSNFKMFENEDVVPCLCTVIYNMSKELDDKVINVLDVELAKNKTNNYKYKNPNVYNIWKEVTDISPSLKLLMDPLNNITKWNSICYNIKDVLYPYCKLLNVEVLLLYNTMQKPKESIKEKKINEVEKNNGPNISNDSKVESNKFDNLPEANVIGSSNNELIPNTLMPDDVQKTKDEININDDENTTNYGLSNKEDDINEEELEKPLMKDIQTDAKINLKSNDDYPQEEDGIISETKTKEAQLIFNQKNTFTNHGFEDVEDSHFLFYFAIMTVLSMLFYLALYNKKKIIALVIEGRRSTNHRRRPNTASYSKVETDDGSTVF